MPREDRDGTFVHVRGRTARMAWVMFLVAFGEFEALLLGTVVLFGRPLESLISLQSEALPAAYLVASAAATVTFYVVRARNAAEARAHAWTEPVDLETLKQRIHPEGLPEDDQRSKVRRMLDENHALAQHGGATISSIAGGQRRR